MNYLVQAQCSVRSLARCNVLNSEVKLKAKGAARRLMQIDDVNAQIDGVNIEYKRRVVGLYY